MLPKYVQSRLVIEEIAYQTTLHGVAILLKDRGNKKWPTFPITIGTYFLIRAQACRKNGQGTNILSLWGDASQSA
jgi:hypothetical protein